MLCVEVNKDNMDEQMEKIKNEEKLSNALPVSIKCEWSQNDTVYARHYEHNAYIGAKIFYRKLKINTISMRTGNVEYIMTQKDHKCRYQKCDFHLSTPFNF